ncbi:MAG: alpha/beta hydrolase [Eubacteriales bacterium]|nr:alpha/beta hydrolase [Eubacteriales bacterium]
MAYFLNMERKTITGKMCHIYTFGTGKDAIILWGTYSFTGKEEESLLISLDRLCKDKNFTLVAYYVNDWNAEFSPWEAEDSNGEKIFTGKGKNTLRWIEEDCLPCIRYKISETAPVYLAGYSLSGLFSLWALYESQLLDGCICCSGSLWMNGWKEYMEEKSAPENTYVYLSLGGKEEQTKDLKMAKVGDRFREQEKILKAVPNVKESILEWNKGGHFADSGKRLAKGISWLITKINEI